MRLRAQNAARARTAIVEAARQEFEQHGFEAASLRRIAAAAGVATGTLFNYADDKVDLLRRVLHDDLEASTAAAVAVPARGPIADQLVAMAAVFLTRFAAQPRLYRALLKESLFATGPRGDAFAAQVERVADEVARRVAASESAADPQLTALSFVSAYYFALITCLASEPPDLDGALRRLRLQLGPILGASP